jgi:hypothetical protein
MYQKTPVGLTALVIAGIKTKIQDAIAAVVAANTPEVALTPEERREGVTVGKERKPFVDYYYGNKNNYPALKPSQTVVTEANAEKHYFDHTEVVELIDLGKQLVELLEDIQLNGEHFSEIYASKGRLAAKNGVDAGIPGADTFFNALDELFPQRGPLAEPIP